MFNHSMVKQTLGRGQCEIKPGIETTVLWLILHIRNKASVYSLGTKIPPDTMNNVWRGGQTFEHFIGRNRPMYLIDNTISLKAT